MLQEKEFDILSNIESSQKIPTQRALAKLTGYSIGTVNSTVSLLEEKGFMESGRITSAGLDALEPFRVKRIIFIAAGFGTRLVPITLNTPKPLVRVHGERIIDSMLDAANHAGIQEIYIVRGYLSEQFDQLLYKYPNIKFIENPAYNEANNISSAMCARYNFGNSYICEADLIIKNPKLTNTHCVNLFKFGNQFFKIIDLTITITIFCIVIVSSWVNCPTEFHIILCCDVT